MKVTKRQLRRIILEFWDKDVERFLIDNAAEYHRDPTLDARSIRMLLMDDFMDHVGHSEDPARYKALIDQLAAGETMAEAEGSTKKYDDDSALKGGQSKLPDGLQKGIIDKAVEDREEHDEEEKEERNESVRITKRQLKKIIREATLDKVRHTPFNPTNNLKETAQEKIEEILNDFYDDLVEDAGMAPEEAQEKMQDLIETIAMHGQQGFIGMPT